MPQPEIETTEKTAAATKRRVLSGMRPTGKLHLGNYVGALQNWVGLQDQYDCFFFVADWHALTTDYADTSAVKTNIIEVATDWLAAGLDPERSRPVSAIACSAARRAAPAVLDDHAAGMAGARAQLQGAAGKPGRQESRHLRLSRLPAAAGGRHSDVPGGLCSGGPGPGGARGADARGGAPLQPVLLGCRRRPAAGACCAEPKCRSRSALTSSPSRSRC